MTLAEQFLLATDPVALAEAAGWTPDPWQAEVLRSTAPRILLLASRQAGKSTTVATIAMHTVLFEPGSLVLTVSPSQRQSAELHLKAVGVWNALGRPIAAKSESALQLVLANGSRLISLPGSDATVRGYSSPRLILMDEAARIPDSLLAAIRPMLAVGQGRQIALTTAWAKRGWFYDAWVGNESYERVKVPARMVPRISAEFLREEERALGPMRFKSEYLCEFVNAEGAVFDMDDVRAAVEEFESPWDLSKYLQIPPRRN